MNRIGAFLTTFLLLFTATGCNRNATNLLPSQLVGFWTTDEPRYQGRFLELYRAYVIIGTGPGDVPKVQAVDSVEASQDGDHMVYKIASTDMSGVQYRMTLLYRPAGDGEILFRHEENILWKRHRESVDPKPAESKAPQTTPRPSKKAPDSVPSTEAPQKNRPNIR
jgi:hypothetical protein